MEPKHASYIPTVPLLASLGLTHVSAADGLMPDEKYIGYANGPEESATTFVCLWNDGTVQIMQKSSGWGYHTDLGPFADEAAFLHAIQPKQ